MGHSTMRAARIYQHVTGRAPARQIAERLREVVERESKGDDDDPAGVLVPTG